MSERGWVKGEWRAEGHDRHAGYFEIVTDGAYVAELKYGDDERRSAAATAHLIAAAPTMAEYIKARADQGDAEAAKIWESINAAR